MAFIIIVLFLVSVAGIRLHSDGFGNPFDRALTESVKGFFICLVFISHLSGYLGDVAVTMPGDCAIRWIVGVLGQMMVVMFLIYSGYGVMKSILQKGRGYINSMPRRRIGGTLLRFDIAVSAFFILNLMIGSSPSLKKICLSAFAWDSLGNSNWYIFVILVCYAVTWGWAVLFFDGACPKMRDFVVLAVSFIVIMITLSFLKERWWYDTILAFPFGCLLAVKEDRFLAVLQKWYWIVFSLSSFLFLVLMKISSDVFGLFANLKGIVFGILVVMVTMRVRLVSPILRWMGQRLFPLYIYQRLPMMGLAVLGGGTFLLNYPFSYVLCCIAITTLIACISDVVSTLFAKLVTGYPNHQAKVINDGH